MDLTSDIQNSINTILNLIEEHIGNKNHFTIILSKSKQESILQCTMSPFLSSDTVAIKIVEKTKTQHFTTTSSIAELGSYLLSSLQDRFYFLDFESTICNAYIKQSKKDKVTCKVKRYHANSNEITIKAHDHKKNYLIDLQAPFLRHLGLISSTGNLIGTASKKYKQINKFVEIISRHVKLENLANITDMGSGKGYLTFGLYHFLSQINLANTRVVGVEMRPDLVDKCNLVAKKCQYDKLSFEQGNIADVELQNEPDMVIALHACDIATDMAISKAIKSNSKYIIVSPCCHKQIRKEITKNNLITNHPIYQERMAEMITDTLRALILEREGYKVKIMEFIESQHTPKNILIIAEKTSATTQTQAKIDQLKGEFGIRSHYLETLLIDN